MEMTNQSILSKEKSWLSDLKDGNDIEDKLMRLMWNRYRNQIIYIHHPGWHFKDYDIAFKKDCWRIRTLEVKYDRQSQKTGNIAFELAYYWKPSGIACTKAELIVYYTDWQWRWANTDGLLDKIIMMWREVKWGDDMASKLYLLRFEEFKTIFTPL